MGESVWCRPLHIITRPLFTKEYAAIVTAAAQTSWVLLIMGNSRLAFIFSFSFPIFKAPQFFHKVVISKADVKPDTREHSWLRARNNTRPGPTSSHLPQSPFPSCATVPGKVNTSTPCQKRDFILLSRQFLNLAHVSVPPSLSSPPLTLSLQPHLEPSLPFIYVVCVVPSLVFLKVLFKSPLPCLAGISIWWGLQLHLAIAGHSAITGCTTESFSPPPSSLSSTTAHMADRNRIVSCLFGWRPSWNYAPLHDWQWDVSFFLP